MRAVRIVVRNAITDYVMRMMNPAGSTHYLDDNYSAKVEGTDETEITGGKPAMRRIVVSNVVHSRVTIEPKPSRVVHLIYGYRFFYGCSRSVIF